MPFRGDIQSLFGRRSGYSPTYGHLTAFHEGKVEGRRVRDGQPAMDLLPPNLVIQDELHLISGPLGTMVGIYETALDYLSEVQSDGSSLQPKVIASTATIRRAERQVLQLYGRELRIFPPSGIDAGDSYFARERAVNVEDDSTAGRLYLGLNAPGSSAKTLLVRTYSRAHGGSAKRGRCRRPGWRSRMGRWWGTSTACARWAVRGASSMTT